MKKPAFFFALALTLFGAGCGKTPAPSINESARSGFGAPENVLNMIESAVAVNDATVRDSVMHGKSMQIRLPASWTGDGPIWRVSESDKVTHIRLAYFSDTPPETEWEAQQATDDHRVLSAVAGEGFYDLIVDHPTLRATIYKRFVLETPDTGLSFYLIECRIAYEADQSAVWSACKTALDSAEFKSAE